MGAERSEGGLCVFPTFFLLKKKKGPVHNFEKQGAKVNEFATYRTSDEIAPRIRVWLVTLWII